MREGGITVRSNRAAVQLQRLLRKTSHERMSWMGPPRHVAFGFFRVHFRHSTTHEKRYPHHISLPPSISFPTSSEWSNLASLSVPTRTTLVSLSPKHNIHSCSAVNPTYTQRKFCGDVGRTKGHPTRCLPCAQTCNTAHLLEAWPGSGIWIDWIPAKCQVCSLCYQFPSSGCAQFHRDHT